MPYYMDRHELAGATAEEVAAAHLQDLSVQDRFGVKYLSYWFDSDRGTAFCLLDAPDPEQARAVHEASHGLLASQIMPVDRSVVETFLGRIVDPTQSGEARPAFRAIMFTDMEGSTDLTQRLGDDAGMEVLRRHDSIVRSALNTHRGTEVKHTGDGIMSSFETVTDSLGCSIAVQQEIHAHNDATPDQDAQFRVRIGIGAGEPVTERGDLFGASVQLAARLCDSAEAGRICVSEAVRELAIGKRFPFGPVEELTLKGFDGPVRVVGLNWQDAEDA